MSVGGIGSTPVVAKCRHGEGGRGCVKEALNRSSDVTTNQLDADLMS
jgi:hypothetical protein